jgi:hypothetical protein
MAQDISAPAVPTGDWKRFISAVIINRLGAFPYSKAEFQEGQLVLQEDGETPAVNFAGQTYLQHLPPGGVCTLRVKTETPEGQQLLMEKLVGAAAALIGEAFAEAGITGQDPVALAQALARRGITVEGVIADGWYDVMADYLADPTAVPVEVQGQNPAASA